MSLSVINTVGLCGKEIIMGIPKIPMDPPKNERDKERYLTCSNTTCKYYYDDVCLYGRIDFDFVMGVGVVCTTYEAKEEDQHG